ncbi:MAG: HPP family protein, partial [Sedimentisphaerales bacterium]|nr:HPP family protein [Sedimentisphaerales bacterium]
MKLFKILKLRLLTWRAKYSLPGLLSRYEESKAVSITAAINAAFAISTISIIAWLTDLPLLFPALGPSTFILFTAPLSPAGAPRSLILGHWICLASGFGIWHLMSLLNGEPVSLAAGGWSLYCSAALALALGSLLMVRLRCPHPPACASALVVALGAVTHWSDLAIMAGVVLWLT